jgi:hypothetical protein
LFWSGPLARGAIAPSASSVSALHIAIILVVNAKLKDRARTPAINHDDRG